MKKKKSVYDEEKGGSRKVFYLFLSGVVIFAAVFIFNRSFVVSLAVFFAYIIAAELYLFFVKRYKKYGRIKKMEEVFPDFISLMASNLRAGMTIDKALLLSSRKEFAPLDKEVLLLGKDIVTGKDINKALEDMAGRIGSEKINKIIKLVTSGIQAGGNLAVLLEETSVNMREKGFIEKRAASNVLMYVIFIFFAVAIGAPVLFSLSSVLVEILTNLLANIPSDQLNVNLPFTLTKVNISVRFVFYFALVFLLVNDILASLVLGLVSKGRERDGVQFILPLVALSLGVFFGARIFLLKYFSEFFG